MFNVTSDEPPPLKPSPAVTAVISPVSVSSKVILAAKEEDKSVNEPLIEEPAVVPKVPLKTEFVNVVPFKAELIVAPVILCTWLPLA